MSVTRFARMAFVVALLFPATAAAEDIKIFLNNTGLDADAMGKARYRDKNGTQRFEVQVSSMDAGDYEATVADSSVGTFTVTDEGDGKLRLQATDLGFDPRSQSVKVHLAGDTGSAYFDSTLPASQDDARRRITVRTKFDNQSGDPKVKGDVKYSSRKGKMMLTVKVRMLPVGTYQLYVDGSAVGDIEVVTDPDGDTEGDTEGKAKYDSRFSRGDKELLSFDPYCVSLAVSETVDLVTTDLLTIDQLGEDCP
jgi:hypothetical protein